MDLFLTVQHIFLFERRNDCPAVKIKLQTTSRVKICIGHFYTKPGSLDLKNSPVGLNPPPEPSWDLNSKERRGKKAKYWLNAESLKSEKETAKKKLDSRDLHDIITLVHH